MEFKPHRGVIRINTISLILFLWAFVLSGMNSALALVGDTAGNLGLDAPGDRCHRRRRRPFGGRLGDGKPGDQDPVPGL